MYHDQLHIKNYLVQVVQHVLSSDLDISGLYTSAYLSTIAKTHLHKTVVLLFLLLLTPLTCLLYTSDAADE